MTGQLAANISEIREMASRGLNTREIAASLDLVEQYVRFLARQNNINVALPLTGAQRRRDEFHRLAAEGKTCREISVAMSCEYTSVHVWARKAGIKLKKGKRGAPAKPKTPTERTRQMAALYQSGKTLQEIGDQFNLTRERVRQLLTGWHGLRAMDGGAHKTAEIKRAKFEATRNARSLKHWGCNFDQYIELRDLKKPTRAYASQRNNARKRAIGWELNLWQWWSIWQQSGKWEQRGRGQGYCMCRKGDAGPYAIDNVFIAKSAENSSEGSRKKSSLPIGVRASKSGATFYFQRMIKSQKITQYGFPTPELAHAAYLSCEIAA